MITPGLHMKLWIRRGVVALVLLAGVSLYALQQGGGRGGVGAGSGRLRNALVVAEIAISIVLLVGAGLLIRTFSALTSVPLGFNPDRLLVVQANLAASTLEQSQRVLTVYDEAFRQISTIPGVTDIAGNTGIPGGPPRSNGGYVLEGGPAAPSATEGRAPS